MKRFALNNGGKIILILLFLRIGASFFEERKEDTLLLLTKKEIKLKKTNHHLKANVKKKQVSYPGKKNMTYDVYTGKPIGLKTREEQIADFRLRVKRGDPRVENQSGWFKVYGETSGVLVVETLYENGKRKGIRNYQPGGIKLHSEFIYEDQKKGDYNKKLYYNSGAIMSELKYVDKKVVSGSCYDLDGNKYPIEFNKKGEGGEPFTIKGYDKETGRELNQTTYIDIEKKIYYHLCE